MMPWCCQWGGEVLLKSERVAKTIEFDPKDLWCIRHRSSLIFMLDLDTTHGQVPDVPRH